LVGGDSSSLAPCACKPKTNIDQDVSEYVVFGRLSSALRSSGGKRLIHGGFNDFRTANTRYRTAVRAITLASHARGSTSFGFAVLISE
jgi:hypothetical protein